MGRVNNEIRSNSAASLLTKSTILDTDIGSLDFKITGYSKLKGMGIGEYIVSETFIVGGYSWAVYFYPNGKSKEHNARYVSCFIALVSDDTNVKALFELTLKDQSVKERHLSRSHFGRVLENGPHSLRFRRSMWGYKRFYTKNFLEDSEYLKDDTLHVHCRVGVVKNYSQGPIIYSIQSGHLLESRKATDVNSEVVGEKFLEKEERNSLKHHREENSKLRTSFLDRGHVVDTLQGERSQIEEDVNWLAAKYDELLPPSKSRSFR